MNQHGYILPACLLFLTLICLVSLTIITQTNWQQRLTAMLLTHTQKDITINSVVSQWLAEKKDFAQDSCKLDWQQTDKVWQKLMDGETCCLLQRGTVTIRYMIITHDTQESEKIALIAHSKTAETWKQFFIQVLPTKNTAQPSGAY